MIIAALSALAMGALWSAQAVGETRTIETFSTRSVEDARLAITFNPEDTHFVTTHPVVEARLAWTREEPLLLDVAAEGEREGKAWSWRVELGGGLIDFAALNEASQSAVNVTWKLIVIFPDGREINAPFTFDDPLYSLPTGDAAIWRFTHDEHDPVYHQERAGIQALAQDPIAPALTVSSFGLLLLAWRIPK